MAQNISVEITGKTVLLKLDDAVAKTTSVAEFVKHLSLAADMQMCDDPLPDGVRFVHRREDHTLVVVEMRPQVRQIKWLADNSPEPWGRGAIYQKVRIAFPYVVLFILFLKGSFSGYQQCFYRVAPITSIKKDDLLLPNLRNCTNTQGLTSWLCIGHMGDMPNVTNLPWNRKITTIVDAFWTRGFNRSPDAVHQVSYWTRMQDLDPRVSSIGAWEQATTQNPSFPLEVAWEPARRTVDDAIKEMLQLAGKPHTITNSSQLIDIVNLCPAQG